MKVNEIKNIYNDSTDGIIILDDGFKCVTFIRTPSNLLSVWRSTAKISEEGRVEIIQR